MNIDIQANMTVKTVKQPVDSHKYRQNITRIRPIAKNENIENNKLEC